MTRSGIIGGLVASVCGVLIWLLVRWHGANEPTKPRPTAAAAPVASATAPTGATPAPTPAPAAEAPAPDKPAVRRIDEATRNEILKQLARAKRAREQGVAPVTGGTPSSTPAPLPGELSPDQIMEGVMAVMPLLKECYTGGLERGTVTRGLIKFDMKMRGEPEIGTLITQADLSGDAAFLKDKELSTCLHETMMSIELPPMSEGAELRVQTSMQFADEPGEAGPEK